MERESRSGQRVWLASLAAIALALALAVGALQPAFADEDPLPVVGAEEELSLLQAQIESTAKDYDDARARSAELKQAIEDNQSRVDQINEQLPAQQDRSAESLKVLYVMQQEGFGLLNMVLASETLTDFLQAVDYMDLIHQHNTAQIEKLGTMKSELQDTIDQLNEDAKAADEAADRAERALEQAKATREQAQQRAIARAAEQIAKQQEIAAQVQAQLAAAAPVRDASAPQASPALQEAQATLEPQAVAETPAAVEQPVGGTDAANTEAPVINEAPEEEAQGVVDAASTPVASDRDSFIAEWTARIDAYLAGSPLAGQGVTFATAAWDYGVDPRWSPAISCAESGKGAACFLPHNAWGWGAVSWGSWEEAINAHVAGLARGYGYTITYEAAAKYCPPNANHWYNTVLGQMNSI